MRISDWSSDVCSSDLANPIALPFATDTRKQMAPIEAIQHASLATFKAWLNANMTIFRKPLELVPPLNSLANMARSVINQEYTGDINRSEEHTSELQSLMRISYAVFCLKKKNKKQTKTNTNHNHTH